MKYVIINEGTISIKRIMCNILIVYFTRKQWGNTDNLYPWHYNRLYRYCWHNYMVWDGNGYTGARRNIRTGGSPKCSPYVQKRPPMYKKAPRMYKKAPQMEKNVAKMPPHGKTSRGAKVGGVRGSQPPLNF